MSLTQALGLCLESKASSTAPKFLSLVSPQSITSSATFSLCSLYFLQSQAHKCLACSQGFHSKPFCWRGRCSL
jgi:hypothetical protein